MEADLKNKIFISFLLLVSIVLLSSCQAYESQEDYFNGDVLVEYYQTTTRGRDDTVTMTFFAPGTYDVSFSYTPGYEKNRYNNPKSAPLPESFSVTVDNSPRTKVISQYILPGFLDITIIRNDISETHSFK